MVIVKTNTGRIGKGSRVKFSGIVMGDGEKFKCLRPCCTEIWGFEKGMKHRINCVWKK